ncbi:MAG: LPS translocon maturation chaperone LptM [Dongiaceae bacterium]
MKKPPLHSSGFLAVLTVALILALSGCGRKGDPEPPSGQKDEFPRQYPDPSTL